MKRFLVALGFLTRLPVRFVRADADDFAAAIRWYPAVGLVVGIAIAGAGWTGQRIDPWIGALLALGMWTWITGALHLDGLADLADGLGAGHRDRARVLAVMGDPHVGSFGAVALVMQLLAKLVLLHAVPVHWPVALIPAAARCGPLAWARWLSPLKAGLGMRVAAAVRARDLAGWALLLAAASAAAPALIASAPLIAGYAWWLRRRLGGVTGDAHGAGIELVESGLLAALCLADRF